MKISVIISIYNGEKDLHIMLESLKVQSFQDIEYILIDNGSTDRTREICRNYADKDSRFRIVEIENNIGYIRARNYGLTLCKGEYITFADADDHVPDGIYEQMYSAAKGNNADWIIAPYYMEYPDGSVKLIPLNIPSGVYSGNAIRDKILPSAFGYDQNNVIIDGFMWRMLFRTELIQKLDNKFYEEAKPREDQLFNQRVACAANTVVVIDAPAYFYRINPDSVTAKLLSDFNLEKECASVHFHFEKSIRNMEEGAAAVQVEHSVYTNLLQSIYVLCLNSAKKDTYKMLREDAKLLQQYFSNELVRKMCTVCRTGPMPQLKKVVMFYLNGGHYFALMCQIKTILKFRGK